MAVFFSTLQVTRASSASIVRAALNKRYVNIRRTIIHLPGNARQLWRSAREAPACSAPSRSETCRSSVGFKVLSATKKHTQPSTRLVNVVATPQNRHARKKFFDKSKLSNQMLGTCIHLLFYVQTLLQVVFWGEYGCYNISCK